MEAQLGLARLLARKGHIDDAVQYCQAALTEAPQSDLAHHTLAVLLATYCKKFESAAAHERDALRHNPNNGEAHLHLATLLIDKFLNEEEALEHARRAVELMPSSVSAKQLLARVTEKIAAQQSDLPPPVVRKCSCPHTQPTTS
jgi:tetratricopeptide (TPR) repeat protein